MTDEENPNISILLVSNSKLLKNKFIESISNDLNNFSLMIKNFESNKSGADKVTLQCFVCDYTVEHENDMIDFDTNYVQLIDGTDKHLINTLIQKTASDEKNNFKFHVNGIVYLFDESNSDTFAYVQSIHNELKKSFGDFVLNDGNLACILCNMINAANLNGLRSSQDDALRIISLVNGFLDDFNNIQYVSQPFEETITGTRPAIEDDNQNKLSMGFNSLISRIVSFLSTSSKQVDENGLNIRSYSNSIKSADMNNHNNNDVSKNSVFQKGNYEGDMFFNNRNGKITCC